MKFSEIENKTLKEASYNEIVAYLWSTGDPDEIALTADELDELSEMVDETICNSSFGL